MESIKENIDQLIWDYPNPFTVSIKVSNNEIDQLGHANNQVYLDWMMKAAYEHSDHDIEALTRGKFKLNKDIDSGEISMKIDYRRKF